MNDIDCKQITELLSEYLDNDLPADSCQEMERHIQNCRECVEFVNGLKESIRLCREYRLADKPTPLTVETKQRLMDAYRRMLAARAKD